MLRNQRRRNIQKKRPPITYQNKDVVCYFAIDLQEYREKTRLYSSLY